MDQRNSNNNPSETDGRAKRASMMAAMLIAFPAMIAVWLSIYFFWPPVSEMTDLTARFAYALKWCCIAILLCLVAGVEAVSHERLQTDAFDPLAGHETRRLKINQRYLQNTLEQTVIFAPGLLTLAVYCADGASMRAVVATAVVWILSRAAFWIGYHVGPAYRVMGLFGVAQSLIVLLYGCGRFGYELGGIAGAAVPLGLFGLIELILVRATRPRSARP